MARIAKKLWDNGFKIYFAFCLLTFTLLILLINVTHVFAAEVPSQPVKAPHQEIPATTPTSTLPRNFYHWTLPLASRSKAPETYFEFRGNKMLFKVNF
jgi:hypothetical protein